MKERYSHELPHPEFRGWDKDGKSITRPVFLPDYVTIEVPNLEGGMTEIEVLPGTEEKQYEYHKWCVEETIRLRRQNGCRVF